MPIRKIQCRIHPIGISSERFHAEAMLIELKDKRWIAKAVVYDCNLKIMRRFMDVIVEFAIEFSDGRSGIARVSFYWPMIGNQLSVTFRGVTKLS